jgi:hypothetical protein
MQTIARSAAFGKQVAPKMATRQSAYVAPAVRGISAQPAHASKRVLKQALRDGRRTSLQVQALFGTKTTGTLYDYKVKVCAAHGLLH